MSLEDIRKLQKKRDATIADAGRAKRALDKVRAERKALTEQIALDPKNETINFDKKYLGLSSNEARKFAIVEGMNEAIATLDEAVLRKCKKYKAEVEKKIQDRVSIKENDHLKMKEELKKARLTVMQLEKETTKAEYDVRIIIRDSAKFGSRWSPEKLAMVIANPETFIADLTPLYADVIGIRAEYDLAVKENEKRHQQEMKKAKEEHEKKVAQRRKLRDRARTMLERGEVPEEFSNYQIHQLNPEILVQHWLKQEGVE